MSKLQNNRLSLGVIVALFAEILLYGSLMSFVWFFSDLLANRNIYCGIHSSSVAAICANPSVLVVKNLSYHFNGYWFAGSCLFLVIGFDQHLRHKGNLYGKISRDSRAGEAVKLLKFGSLIASYGLTLAFASIWVVDLFSSTRIFVWLMQPVFLLGATLVLALYSVETWSSIPKLVRRVPLSRQLQEMTLEDLGAQLLEDMDTLGNLREQFNVNGAEVTASHIRHLEDKVNIYMREASKRHHELEVTYDGTQAIIDRLYNRRFMLERESLSL